MIMAACRVIHGVWAIEDEEGTSTNSIWKCDLCGKTGKGDAHSFFSLDEVEHFLEARCIGSLRQHVEAGLVAKSAQPAESPKLASAALAVQEGNRKPTDATTCLSSPMRGITAAIGENTWLGHEAIGSSQHNVIIGPDAIASDESGQIKPEQDATCDFGSIWVKARQTLFINTSTKMPFRVRRLLVPSSVAGHFMINGLMLGNLQLLSNSYPAILFTETSTGISLRSEEVHWPHIITLSVTNMTQKGKWFQGALIGLASGENGTVNNPNQALDNLILRTVELKRSLEKERQAQRELLQKVRLQELTKAEFEKLLKLQGFGRPDGGESIADRELRALFQDTPTGEGD